MTNTVMAELCSPTHTHTHTHTHTLENSYVKALTPSSTEHQFSETDLKEVIKL